MFSGDEDSWSDGRSHVQRGGRASDIPWGTEAHRSASNEEFFWERHRADSQSSASSSGSSGDSVDGPAAAVGAAIMIGLILITIAAEVIYLFSNEIIAGVVAAALAGAVSFSSRLTWSRRARLAFPICVGIAFIALMATLHGPLPEGSVAAFIAKNVAFTTTLAIISIAVVLGFFYADPIRDVYRRLVPSEQSGNATAPKRILWVSAAAIVLVGAAIAGISIARHGSPETAATPAPVDQGTLAFAPVTSDGKLVAKFAQRNHLVITNADIASRIAAIKQGFQDAGIYPFTKAPYRYWAAYSATSSLASNDTVFKWLVFLRVLTPSITISESDVRTFYDHHPKPFIWPVVVDATSMFFTKRETAQSVRDKIAAGQPWSHFAAAIDYNRGLRDFDVAPHFGLIDQTFYRWERDAIAATRAGGVAGPFRLPLGIGWEIYRVNARTTEHRDSLATAHDLIVTHLTLERVISEGSSLLKQWRSTATTSR